MASRKGGVPKDRAEEVATARRAENEPITEQCAERFRAELAAFCERNGGQIGAAPLLGTDQPAISRWLDKKKPTRPHIGMMIALSRATGRSLEDLLGLSAPAPAPAAGSAEAMLRRFESILAAANQRAEEAEERLRRQSSHVRESSK